MGPAAGTWVTLHRVGKDTAGPIDSVRTDGQGHYRFRWTPFGTADGVYFASTTWGGIAYFTPPLKNVDARGDDAEITVRIVDADEGRALNRAYRAKDYATNVLTFDQHIPICGDFRFQHRILSQAAHQNARSPVHEPLGEALM